MLKVMRQGVVRVWWVGLCGLILVSCSTTQAQTEPLWTKDDVNARLRDYLVASASDKPDSQAMLVILMAIMDAWDPTYVSDGSWEVMGFRVSERTGSVVPGDDGARETDLELRFPIKLRPSSNEASQ